MKTTKLFTLALGALLLAGCSSDAIDDPGNGSGGDSNTAGKGYISLSINLPTRTQTAATARATGDSKNDQYDDGTTEEYKVNDAYLLIFKKGENATKEADYTFSSAYNLDDAFTKVGTTIDAITTRGETVVKVNEDMASSANLYGLVVLNGNDIFTAISDKPNEYKIGNTYLNGSTKFGDFMSATATGSTAASEFTEKGFFMTNAVLVDKSGIKGEGGVTTDGSSFSAKVQTLVPLEGKICATENEAQKAASEFFVERAVAKVNVTGNTITSGITNVNGTSVDAVGVAIEGWDLGNTNKSTYAVRNWGMVTEKSGKTDVTGNAGDEWLKLTSSAYATDGDNPYRFAGITAQQVDKVPTDKLYRTYFGYDPNFVGNSGLDGNIKTKCETTTTTPLYCLENTFNVANQNINNTTCAIIKVKLTLPTGDSYSWTEDGSSTTPQVFYTIGMGGNGKGKIYDYNGMCKELSKYAASKYETEISAKLQTGKKLSNYTPTYTFETVSEDGVKKLKDIVWKLSSSSNDESTDISLSSITGAVDNVNNYCKVSQYADACTYYRVPIKHFGDDLTPWSQYTDDKPAEKSTKDAKKASYPDNNANNYLGRYGVLRNNWYTLEVTEVKQIGSPTVPDITNDTTPDDEIESYIAVNCNVLSWAKRIQDVILK